MSLAISLLLGAGLGAGLGYFGQCNSGTCPLTSTWWRGAIWGAVLGTMFWVVSGQSGTAAMNQSSKNVKLIKPDEFSAEVEQATLPVVVDFYAPWCGPCRTLAPRLDELAGQFGSRLKFVKVNIDEAPNLADRFRISGVPTLMFFRNGKVVDSLVGLTPAPTLKARLESLAGNG